MDEFGTEDDDDSSTEAAFGAHRLVRDGEHLTWVRKVGHENRTNDFAAGHCRLIVTRLPDEDPPKWTIFLVTDTSEHQLFTYREQADSDVPGGVRAWAEELDIGFEER